MSFALWEPRRLGLSATDTTPHKHVGLHAAIHYIAVGRVHSTVSIDTRTVTFRSRQCICEETRTSKDI